MTLLPLGVHWMKDAVSRAFSWENPYSGTRVSVEETGWKDICDPREADDDDGD